MIYKRLLSSILWAFAALGAGSAALGQTSDDMQEGDAVLEEVIVTGVKYSLTEAVQVKRESMQIVDAIVSEDIGRFPDNQVAEALQRIPGVQTTNRGNGEVSRVAIRGLESITTTVNGRNIFTASGRAVALQDIPATLVQRVDVYKTRSPENLASGIAGQIDIHTFRPFDFEDMKVSAQARAIYADEADEIDPAVSVLWSNRWDTGAGEFGLLLNASYVKTNYRDQIAISGASVPFRPPDDPVFPLERLFPPLWTPGLENGLPTAPGSTLDIATDVEFVHARDAVIADNTTGERERPAWNLSAQWAPNDRSEYTFEALYNGYRRDRYTSLWFQFVDWWGSVDPADPVELYPGTNVIKSRYVNNGFSFTSGDTEQQKTDSYLYALRGDWNISDDFNLESEVVYQDSEFQTDFFAVRFARVYPRLFIDFNAGNGMPAIEYVNADPADANAYWLDWAYDNAGRSAGDALTWTADGDYTVEWAGFNLVSFGVRYDNRSASQYDIPTIAGGPLPGNGFDDFPGIQTTTKDFFPQAGLPHEWAVASGDYIVGNTDALRAAYGFPLYDPNRYLLNFLVDETQLEAYLQADFNFELANGGFVDGRVGFRWMDAETDMSVPDPDSGGLASGTNSNSTFLPSLMVRWGITEDLLARFSYTETFNLPSFSALSPYIDYIPDVTDIGYGQASGGNPDLDPEESKNYDVSLEWYFSEGGVLYGTWFKRDIDGWIVPYRNVVVVDLPDDLPDLGPYPFILSQPANAGKGKLDGWEFGLTWFPELPGLFDGFGVQASYTILDSSLETPQLDDEGNVVGYAIAPFLGVSDSSYSVILAYDRESFNARLSYFWREEFHASNQAALFASPLSIWNGPEKALDFQATWRFSDRWSLTFDGTNLTEEIYKTNYGNEPEIFNIAGLLYSRTFALGLRFDL